MTETHIQLTNNMISSRTFEDWVKVWNHMNARIEQLEKREIRYIDQINRLQEACMPQLIQNMKLDIINWLTERYGSKAFKDYDVRVEFENRGYGFMPAVNAIKDMVEKGELTYKRGWYRLVFAGASNNSKPTEAKQ